MNQAEAGNTYQSMGCSRCGWRYLITGDQNVTRCPNCWSDMLSPFLNADIPVDATYAELVLPFTLKSQSLQQHIEGFTAGIPFAPVDLKAETLAGRLIRVFIPAWLVDVDVEATWEAETGYNYQVVSHQDQYNENGGGWTSQKVNEGRVRWEPRWGTLKRTYQNVTAPALENQQELDRPLGGFKIADARSFITADLNETIIRQPDRNHKDAWQDAQPGLQGRAGDECRQAAGADHIRQFKWTPSFANQNWSLLLMPVYATYYLDDSGLPQPVQIHGQSGQITGKRIASIKRAQQATTLMLVIAGVFFVLGLLIAALGMVIPPAIAFGGGLMLLALLIAVGAVLPVGIAWNFNRNIALR